mgnify:CR=1 FL=1
MNSCLRSEASNCSFFGRSISQGLSSDKPANQEGSYFFYNPPASARIRYNGNLCELNQTFKDIDGVFCVCVSFFFVFPGKALEEAFYSFAASFSKMVFLIFHQNVKFQSLFRSELVFF